MHFLQYKCSPLCDDMKWQFLVKNNLSWDTNLWPNNTVRYGFDCDVIIKQQDAAKSNF